MLENTFTLNIDITTILLNLFVIFFIGLIFYLRREDRREGYPLEADTTGRLEEHGVFWVPEPKTFRLADGAEVQAPAPARDDRPIAAKPIAVWPGAPLEPTGSPMHDGVGPAAYAQRRDVPDRMPDGQPKIVPMRTLAEFALAENDPDPRGMRVVGAAGKRAGEVVDVWVDRGEHMIRYLELELDAADAPAPAPAPSADSPDAPAPVAPAAPVKARVLLPMPIALINKREEQVEVRAIYADQFSDVPRLKSPEHVTFLEEEKISAYYAGGLLYASPKRVEPYV